MFKIFNNKTKKIEELNKYKKINIYLCGPTLYNHLHIGNFRNIVIFDCLRKILKELNYKVDFIQNLTDIDDKIINKAINENKTEKEITDKFKLKFLELLNLFNIKISKLINVTNNIESIKDIIKELLNSKKAYKTLDGIYFEIDKDKHYGRFKKNEILSNNIDFNDTNKKNLKDFAIWKFKTKGKTWDSIWGKGRPGWHIECAVIINKFFKTELTIHGGGKDLIFPHHENEYAILNSINNKIKNTIWVHNGFVEFEAEKISKSKKNFELFLVKNLLKRYSSNTIKIFFYFSNYKYDINFSFKHLDSCQKLEKKIKTTFKKIEVEKILNNLQDDVNINKVIFNEFVEKISFDLDTIGALDLIFKQLKNINHLLHKNLLKNVLEYTKTLKKCLFLLGIQINLEKITKEIKIQIINWKKFIQEKKFEKADKIRQSLIEKDIF